MAAFKPLLRQRALPVAAAAMGAGMTFFPLRNVHAESPEDRFSRKPIYDDSALFTPPPSPPSSTEDPVDSIGSFSSSITERLASQIKHGRLFLHSQAVVAEDQVNRALNRTMALEHSFTSTIASLAPPKESNERLVPGMLYVLVSSMAGSILTRNRNIFLRASVPAAVGFGMAWAVLPITMGNVSDLAWTYEQRFPALAENHIRAKERVQRFFATGKAHSAMTVSMLEEKISDAREAVEGWVRKGK